MIEEGYFSVEMAPGVYLIGCDETTRNGRTGREVKPQKATGNGYLIIGEEKAMLIDSCGNLAGYRAFVESLVDLPVMLILSHGHFDHTCRLCEFDEFWISKEDEELLHGKYDFPLYEGIPRKVHYLKDGDLIDLGNRPVEVHMIQGHTDGSLMFLDRRSRILFSGDSIARRLLYGTGKWVPLSVFIGNLKEARAWDFDRILSAHDRCFLKKDHIDYMIQGLLRFETEKNTISLGPFGSFIWVVDGKEEEEKYLDMTVPVRFREDIEADLKAYRNHTENF